VLALCLEAVVSITPYYDRGGVTLYHAPARDVLPFVEADVLITDPDYGVGMNYTEDEDAKGLTADEADALLVETLQLARIRSGHGLIFWSGSWGRIQKLDDLVTLGGWEIKHFGIWYKPNGAGASGNGMARRFETWFWIQRPDAPSKKGEWSRLPDCIEVSRIHRKMTEGVGHPSQKPIELMRRLVRFFSMPGDVVLEPFAGSGTTLRAAQELGRIVIASEINEDYCKVAVDRLRQEVLSL
jgi:site-specific DNA-methyltransferase (adenine-specific)